MARSVGLDRARVVTVAAEIADAVGLDALTLAEVAARLGVKLPSLYNHVSGLPGLRRELALLGAHQLHASMSRATIGKAGDAAVFALSRAYRSYINAHPGVYAATVRAPALDDSALQHVSQAIIEVIFAVLDAYDLPDKEVIHAVRGLRSIVHGFATLELAGGFAMDLDRDESFELLLHAYVVGLRARKAS